MARIELRSSEDPQITVESVNGSLQVRGWDSERIRIEVRNEADVQYTNDVDVFTLRALSDCVLRVPGGSTLAVQQVTRDAYVHNLEGSVTVEQVAGSLTLRNVGETNVQHVAGSLTARNVEGSLTVDEVSGNASVRNIEGDFIARNISANLAARHIEGDVQAVASGNADLRLDSEGDISLEARGNLFCRLNDAENANVTLESGAHEIHISTPEGKSHLQTSNHQLTLGDGSQEVRLVAAGLVDFRSRGGELDELDVDLDLDLDFLDDSELLAGEITEQVTAQLDAQMESVNQQLKQMQDRLRHSTDRASQRAQQRVAAAQRRLQNKLQQRSSRVAVAVQPRKPAPVSEQERMLILQMVQDKKISVAQAEMLLNVIEGRGTATSPTPPTPPEAPAPPVPPRSPEAPSGESDA